MNFLWSELAPYIDDYAIFHRRSMKATEQHKTMTFSTEYFEGSNKKWVGGFADRLKGMLSAFLLAIVTNRKFFADWKTPTVLSEHLAPSAFDWRLVENINNNDKPLIIDAIDSKNYHTFVLEYLKGAHNAEILDGYTDVVVHSNMINFYDVLANRDLLSQSLFGRALMLRESNIGMERTVAELTVLLFGSLFRYMPLPEFERRWADFEVKRRLGPPVIGVHFRTGGDNRWWDPQMDKLENIPLVSAAVRRTSEDCFGGKAQVLITSDSENARKLLLETISKTSPCYSYDGNIAHYERSSSIAQDEFQFLLFEFLCLSRCDFVIHGAGEYALTAAKVGGKPYSSYGHCP